MNQESKFSVGFRQSRELEQVARHFYLLLSHYLLSTKLRVRKSCRSRGQI
jgi:hypothetical protein